jgi:hypothetical protein
MLEFYRANGLVPPAAAQAQIPAPAAPVPVPTREPAGNMNLPNITYGDIVLNIDSKMFTKVPGVAAGRNNLTADGLAARGIRVG